MTDFSFYLLRGQNYACFNIVFGDFILFPLELLCVEIEESLTMYYNLVMAHMFIHAILILQSNLLYDYSR